MWKLERETNYFKIYDSKKTIAGYFAPEYGEIYPEDKANEIIEEMHKRHEEIRGGYLMLPMIKFGVFDEGKEMNLDYLIRQVDEAKIRLSHWQNFISNNNIKNHKIMVSHTDHDMLSITFGIMFSAPIPLEKNRLQDELGRFLNSIQQGGLL